MPVIIPCDICNKSFSQKAYKFKQNKNNFCSTDCRREWDERRRRASTIALKCQQCGKIFERPEYEAARSRDRFCSYACSREFLKNRTAVLCAWCGKPCEKLTRFVEVSTNSFCSVICNAAWKQKHQSVIVVCKTCGESFRRKANWVKRHKYTFCSHACYSEWNEGERSIPWQGGKSFEPYPEGFNGRLKREIRNRDGHVCRVCGKTRVQEGRELCVHHIDYNKDNLSHINLIAVCNSCNIRANNNRTYWQARLQAYQKARGLA